MYNRKYKDGDRVHVRSYGAICIVTGIDEFGTSLTGDIHYTLVDEDYRLGKCKSTHADPASEDELTLVKE